MHPASKRFIHLSVGATLFFSSMVTAIANDAVILLNQMHDALHKLEYQGKLVYVKDGEVSNLSVRHIMENGAEKEIISPLDENGDEYVKESPAFSLTSIPKITPKMQEVYSFDIGGMGKVAGRPCRIVIARPKDRKRYLQKYCIDLDRSVLLKYSLINQHHQPVERFMFTDFEVISTPEVAQEPVDDLDDADILQGVSAEANEATPVAMNKMVSSLAPQTSAAGVAALPNDTEKLADALDSAQLMSARADSTISAPDNYSEWFFDPLPAGFNIINSGKFSDYGGNDEQVVISDGLSSVSVFISVSEGEGKHYRPIRSGALNILTRNRHGHYITLVGEVPKSTLEDIYKGLKRATIKK